MPVPWKEWELTEEHSYDMEKLIKDGKRERKWLRDEIFGWPGVDEGWHLSEAREADGNDNCHVIE